MSKSDPAEEPTTPTDRYRGPSETAGPSTDLNRISSKAFRLAGEYIEGELSLTRDCYVLLEKMNRETAAKYREQMTLVAEITKRDVAIRKSHQQMMAYVKQVDDIHYAITKLEEVALEIEVYSKRLEFKFKDLIDNGVEMRCNLSRMT